MSPRIADGALVLIDSSRNRVQDDGIYAIVLDGDVRLKRIQKSAVGALKLISDNTVYPPEILSGLDARQLVIAGKVFWSGGEL
jgi:phage repressor protein C with HTH and peptisase S24 domain